jgi:hypothetical protein
MDHVGTDGAKWVAALLVVFALVGCATTTTPPPVTAPTATAVPSPVHEVMGEGATGRLVSRRVDSPPVIDGLIEGVWATAEPLRVPLVRGMGSTEHVLDVELRALHTDETVSFVAQWPGEPPFGEERAVSNKLTLHWRIPERAAQGLDCTVVCHTAFADGSGRFVYANAETIPQGGSETLPAAGQWDAGTWTLEWSRPLASDNPFDLQFDDLGQAYSFLVKIFERIEGRADPISERYLLVFQP